MRKSFAAFIAVTQAIMVAPTFAAPITYNLADLGAGLSGTITTDGAMGQIGYSDVLSWSVYSGGHDPFVASYALRTGLNIDGVTATPTALTMAWSPQAELVFLNSYSATMPYFGVGILTDGPTQVGYEVRSQPPYPMSGGTLAFAGSGPSLTVATVPEPSSIALLTIGAIGLAAVARRRSA